MIIETANLAFKLGKVKILNYLAKEIKNYEPNM